MNTNAIDKKQVLKVLAALVWLIGALVLLMKAGSLLLQARGINPEGVGIWCSLVLGGLIGLAKARFIFVRSCRKNLARIENLPSPQLWQFYRPGFFLFLAAMITLGAFLSRVSQGEYFPLLMVAALDLSIATALLFSSSVFVSHR